MKKGFTLIEILIASTIFAVIMLIVTGTFTWASSYNGRLKEMRDTSLSARKAMDMISRDVRQANGSVLIRSGASNYDISELAFMKCPQSSPSAAACTLTPAPNILNNFPTQLSYTAAAGVADYDPAKNNVNSIIVIQKDRGKLVIYRTIEAVAGSKNFDLYRYEANIPTLPINIATSFDVYTVPDRTIPNAGWSVVNNQNTSLKIEFAGYGANDAVKTQQPYVQTALRAQSWNYNSLQPAYRAQFDLKSTIETRDYN